jgi:hypothetical protein
MEVVIGSPQDDTFLFPLGALFSGTLDGYTGPGGPDNDHLDFSLYPAGITVDADGPGTLDGIQGQVLGIVGHFDNMNLLTGTAFLDTFIGSDQDDTFIVQATQIIMQTGGVQTQITFTGIEVLDGDQGADTFNIEGTNNEITRMIGNLGNDTFIMIGDALVPGQIDGSDDPDLLDIDALDYRQWNAAAVVDLVTGSATGIFGDADGGIVRIESVYGSAFIDTIYGDEFDNILAGDEGQDRLIGRGGNDTYVFGDDWSLDEVVEEPGGGTDTLDFSAVTTAVTFTLDPAGWHVDDTAGNLVTIINPEIEGFIGSQGYSILDASAWGGYWDVFITDPGTYTGFAGTLEDLSRTGSLGVFDNLDEFIANPTLADRLTGLDGPGVFTFTDTQTDYTVDGLVPNMLVFSNFDTLRGGSGDDTFILNGDISISRSLDGQGGSDTVDYSLFTTSAVVVDLLASPPTATALDGGFTAIENFTGTPLDDEFTGDEHDNTFEGGLGDDTYYFTDEWGNDTITDSGGAADTLDFSLLTGDLTVQVYTGNLTISDGINTLDVTLNSLEQISTGSGDDQFIFMDDGAQVSGGVGMFDAGLGINRIDYQGYTTTSAVVDLVAGTATGTNGITGFRDIFGGGGEDILSGDDQDNILRGLLGDDLITGAGGVDTLDESWSATDLNIDLSQTLAQVTGIGSDTITGVENLITGSGNDQLCGDAQDNHLQGGSGNDTYCFYDGFGNDMVTDAGGANDTLDFSALTQALTFHIESPLTVSEATNLVTNLGSDIETLTGGSAPDNFIFADGAALTGGLDGRTGADTIDWSAYSTPRNVTLISLGPLDGFAGSEASSGAFTNIDLLQGGLSLADALLGANLQSVWNAGLGSYTAGLASLAYSGFELLNGNADDDIFQFTTPAVFAGNIDGGGGTDTLDYQTYPADVTIDLQNATTSSLNGIFSSFETLLGSPLANDTLVGRNVSGTFELDGTDRYITVSGTWSFSGFEILTGGTQDNAFQLLANVAYNLLGGLGNDLFAFGDGVTLTGWLDGDGGTNTLDLSAFTAPRIVLLTAPGASIGFDGQDAALTDGFQNINLLVATPALTDNLQGIDQAATWNFGGVVNLYNSAGRSLGFREFEFYTGGSGDDTFSLGDGVTIPGIVDAGAGVDTLDLSAYTTDVIIDLMTGEATGIRGGLPGSALNFENASGGSGNDFLYGNGLNNILRGNAGNDSLDGRAGDDSLWTGPGTDILIGGPGYDTGYIHWLSQFTVPFGDVEYLVYLKPPPGQHIQHIQRIQRILPVFLIIIVDSGEVVDLDCVFCDGFILRLRDAPVKEVLFWKGVGGTASLTHAGLSGLPGPLEDIYIFVDGIYISVFDFDGVPVTVTGSNIRVSFFVPDALLQRKLLVLHWDASLNQGQGGWVVLALNEIDRLTGRVSLNVNQTGWYLLVMLAEDGS